MFTHITIKRIELSGCLGIKLVSEMTMLSIQKGSFQVFLFSLSFCWKLLRCKDLGIYIFSHTLSFIN